MPSLTPTKPKAPPVVAPVGYNLHIRKSRRKAKFGLRDNSQQVDLLLMVYDRMELYPGTTYLMVYQDELVGVYDILLRMWLVPVQFTSIYLTKTPMLFIVYLDRKRGLYDGVRGQLTWS